MNDILQDFDKVIAEIEQECNRLDAVIEERYKANDLDGALEAITERAKLSVKAQHLCIEYDSIVKNRKRGNKE